MRKSRTLRRSLKRLYCNSHSEGLSRTAQASWWNDKYDRLLHLDCIRQSCQHAVLLLFLARQQLNPSSAEHGASDPLPTSPWPQSQGAAGVLATLQFISISFTCMRESCSIVGCCFAS